MRSGIRKLTYGTSAAWSVSLPLPTNAANAYFSKIYEFVRGAALFDPYWNNATSGMHLKQTHIAQIVGLRGNFPRTLLDQGTLSAQYFDDRGSCSCFIMITAHNNALT